VKSNTNIVLSIAILTFLLIVLTLFTHKLEHEIKDNQSFLREIFDIKQFSQELETEFLKTNFYLYHNYDTIQSNIKSLNSQISRIKRFDRLNNKEFGELKRSILKFEKEFIRKEKLIDRFLTVNTTVKNAVNYIPNIAVQFFSALDSDKIERNRELFHILSQISSMLLLAKNSLDIDFISKFKEHRLTIGNCKFRTDEVQELQKVLLLNLTVIIEQFPVYVELLKEIENTKSAETIKKTKEIFFSSSMKKMQERIWWLTILLNVMFFIVLGVIVYLLLKVDKENRSLKKLHQDIEKLNESLEQKVFQRTEKLQEINSHITDSIQYASLIQKAIISEHHHLSKHFEDFFIIWNPRDIVGGDIYFIEELNDNELIVMVIDSTGHGVPGAFVTMLVKAVERQIFSDLDRGKIDKSTSKMLSYFNREIKNLLKQNSSKSKSNVGFDGAIVYINREEKIIKYSGASTPLFYKERGKDLKMLKGDKKSIGYRESDESFEFKEEVIKIENPTDFYLTTDGYIDQLGGSKEFPFGKKRFKYIIEKYYDMPFSKQREIFVTEFDAYRRSNSQVDDVTVIGFKV